jgi:UDPglucose--hexose-1-phosphate uridylyltransferase
VSDSVMLEYQSQYRYDILQKRWVIIASERGKRPDDFSVPRDAADSGFCPFCPGNEEKTPRQILSLGADGRHSPQGWRVRVVPNKFPALRIEGDPSREAEGLYDKMNGIGAHEVVIETPDHNSNIADRSVDEICAVLKVFRDRLLDLMNDTRLKYILVFKNHRAAAGASLAHPHSQIIATTVTPRTIALELNACREHHHVKERCLICDIIKQEIADRERLIGVDERFVAFCPYASRFPFEAFIAPRYHQHDYSMASDDELRGLAGTIKDTLSRLKRALDDPPYNFILHSAPNARVEPRRSHYWDTIKFDFHWHIELLPRLTRVAGFEWGSGFYINPTPPEEAAKFLRSV